MSLPEFHLFIGCPVEGSLAEELKRCNHHLKATLLNGGDNYLWEVNHQGTTYLGKFVGNQGNLSTIRLIQTNIYSLLKKLVPDYPCNPALLLLLALERP